MYDNEVVQEQQMKCEDRDVHPRWTPENRPLIDTSKPATTSAATETADY